MWKRKASAGATGGAPPGEAVVMTAPGEPAGAGPPLLPSSHTHSPPTLGFPPPNPRVTLKTV